MIEQRCSACGRMMAKPRRGLSTIEFRRTVHRCADRDSLRENTCKLIKIFRNVQDADLTVAFSQGFDARLNDEWWEAGEIKLWLLRQINSLDGAGEKAVYQLLFDLYAREGIKESFAVFYDIYAERTDNPLSKNFVSRALRALGLKTRMVRMVIDDAGGAGSSRREKSVISIQATATELQDIFRKNGIVGY